MGKKRSVVAAGHEITAEAARAILREGGNAFDAVLAAMCASCVAEPVLASLGGGGFLLACSPTEKPILYDFFTQTPLNKLAESEVDFYPIVADFGAAQQEFHIGMGSIATPGMVRGLSTVHRDLCRLPLSIIVEPAIQAARDGVRLNTFQHYISKVVDPIINTNSACRKIHTNKQNKIAEENDLVVNHELADVFEILAIEGEDLFYRGELGQRLVKDCLEQGGYICIQDLEQYRVARRTPLQVAYHGANLLTNPAPSIGGTLIAFSLSLLEPEQLSCYPAGSVQHLSLLAHAMRLTQQLRHQEAVDKNTGKEGCSNILSDTLLESYRKTLQEHRCFPRGTTHISVIDADDHFASMTLSNGEGAGYVLPGTGIMMNNMLGEEDINPHGFHQWPTNRRIASMMAPTIAFVSDGRALSIGSSGSNRIRSAIMQVLINLLDFNMNLDDAVEYSRIHFESGLLNLEIGPVSETLDVLLDDFPQQKLWPEKNLFFGGTHCVLRDSKGDLYGKGDSRRGGVSVVA